MNLTYRVYRNISDDLREKLLTKRAEIGPLAAVIEKGVTEELGKLIKELEALFVCRRSKNRPWRVGMPDAVLKALRDGSAKTGLPAVELLRVCLMRSVAGSPAPSARKAKGKAPGRKKRTRKPAG